MTPFRIDFLIKSIEDMWGTTNVTEWLKKEYKSLIDHDIEREKMLVRIVFDEAYKLGFMDCGKSSNVDEAWKNSESRKQVRD